ncbi:Pimeloyl-ACP methyl ester carboxylesterase [Salegentibacter holothuriorum]|uniref:Pimeloyl-ACP methyl ester carboxylesterase n=1 Tax=Salegentibacter holothuriorum TaxID=241145 RepID=A0A1T5BGP3_9FLAO|nr:alpha/beta fold hydrolase [Salegentibacter holothuriorum]SKB46471.1 Pimeloyl-ACP methyl ester carboxylesterase [Salegentibacter holothuriorum]
MKLNSIIIGEGAPLLILHGFLGMSDNWKTIGNKLAEEENLQVHLIDQRNHGKSPHTDAHSYELMAKDIEEYCEQHSLSNIILMGHSMGGKTAMLAAANYPNLVKKLIVVDIAPKYYEPHHQQILKGLTALEDTDLESRQDADKILSEFISEKPVRLFLLKNLKRKSEGTYCLKVNLETLKNNIEEIGRALPQDKTFKEATLFVKGGNSNYIKEEDKADIKSQFPKAEFKEIANAGHWVHAEKMNDFYSIVVNFL